jgi:hypothetical protein
MTVRSAVGRIVRATDTKAEAEIISSVHIGDVLQFPNGAGYATGRIINITTTRGQGLIANLEFEKPLREVPRLFTPLTRLPNRIPVKVSLHIGEEANGRNVWIRINALFSGLLVGGLIQEGKTHLALVIGEELIERQVPVLIIDSQGEFLGLSDTFSDHVHVCDGSHRIRAAQVLRDLKKRKTVIVNLLGLSNVDKGNVATKILNDLKLEKEADYKRGPVPTYPPVIVLIDEAEIYAPSHMHRAVAPQCRFAIMDIVKRMGKFGIGTILITQRLPMLDPDSRSQCGSSAFFRLTDAGSLGIAKLMSYVTAHDVELIRNLSRGQCLLAGKIVSHSIITHVKPAKSPRTKSLDFEKQLGLSAEEVIVEDPVEEPTSNAIAAGIAGRTIRALAEKLGVSADVLSDAMPEVLVKGSRSFGARRLELREKDGSIFASVWIGASCQCSVPITENAGRLVSTRDEKPSTRA